MIINLNMKKETTAADDSVNKQDEEMKVVHRARRPAAANIPHRRDSYGSSDEGS
jgi:hypothetical protein